eukprot:m51a1_g8724 putative glycosyltransferase family 8 protein (378) ;mRNA; f:179457-180991
MLQTQELTLSVLPAPPRRRLVRVFRSGGGGGAQGLLAPGLGLLAAATLVLLAVQHSTAASASADAAGATAAASGAASAGAGVPAEQTAYVFVALSDAYVRLALGLQAGLRAVGAQRRCLVLAGPAVGPAAEGAMRMGGLGVARVASPPGHRNWRPLYARWAGLLSKLEVFRLPLERVVYLDLDTVLRGNPDDLFDRPEQFVASQDNWGCDTERPGTMNSGVMVIRRDNSTYDGLLRTLDHNVIVKGDQELIAKYWRHRLGRITTLPDSYSTYHTRYSDSKRCQWVNQSFRRAKIIHLADARVDWDVAAVHGGNTPGLPAWARPFIEMFKEQNDRAGRQMLELARHEGVDPSVVAFVTSMYANLANATSSSSANATAI